jgi:hypothetical protein
MAAQTYITGLDDALKCFDQAPGNLLKVVRQAMKEGGKQAAKEIRKAMPRRFKRLVSSKVVKGAVSGDYSALIGAFNRVKSGTDEPDDWFKAYWKNYGTLTKRDKDHTFDYPVKKLGRPRRNEVGQDAEHFYDRAVAPAQQTFIRAFQESLKAQEDKLKER